MFIHLHVHSHYSLLDAACKIEGLLDSCKAHGMPALALTDHGNLFGAVDFYSKARDRGIKPVVGCEVYMAPGSRFERKRGEDGDSFYHLVLLAKDHTGFKNLSKLVSAGYLEGFYYKPRIDKELLAAHAEGLIGLTACLKSEILRHYLLGREEEAEHSVFELAEILGKDNLYLEMQDHGIPEQREANAWLPDISKRSGVPLVVTNDVHYIDRADSLAHDALLCIGTGKVLSDEKRKKYSSSEFYFKSPREMSLLFPDHIDAVERTQEVADRCNLIIPFGEYHFPRFECDHPGGNAAYLRFLCEEGLSRRYGEKAGSRKIKGRLDMELGVIEKQGFVNYFLIVWDFVRFAREQGIPVGPGRGSAAGSIVAFTLGITNLDPLPYDLLFERFLNAGRNEPPDIDIDFCERRREEVIRYVRERYGEDNVCQIITFGTLKARAAVRDVGRVLEIPLPEVDALAKKIPENTNLDEALEKEPELKERAHNDERVGMLFDIARRLEGLCRHASTHAAGVVISDKPLKEYVPLYTSKGEVTTQFDMNDLVKIGLLKMDFLGLKNLTIIDLALKNIRKTGSGDLDLENLPYDDPETYALISRGETTGVFQLESSGMRDLLQKIRPNCFEDLLATIAIYRPGPLGSGMVDSYVAVKHGQQKAEYLDPELEPILKETHGMILYQEQAMRIANRIAGFSLEDADHLRKAMSKKKDALMEEYRQRFVEGAVASKKPAEVAEQLFAQIRHFAGYGFNKSHSAAYAVITYRTAYLKTHHAPEFNASCMSVRSRDIDAVVKHVEECRRTGIEVLPPDINTSMSDFSVEGSKVRYGLAAVRGIGEKAVLAIIEARDEKGPFSNLFDFCRRVDLQAVNRRVGEALIYSGAMDSLGTARASLIAGIDVAYASGTTAQNYREAGQKTFFDSFEDASGFQEETLPSVPEWTEREKLAHEKATLGFYLTSHPLAHHEATLESFSDTNAKRLSEDGWDGNILLGGMITGPQVRRVKSGKNEGRKFASFHLEDLTGSVEAVAFSDAFDRLKNLIVEDRIVFLRGRAERRGGSVSIYVDDIVPVESARETLAEKVTISMGFAGVRDELLHGVRDRLRKHRGNCQVVIEFWDPSKRKVLVQAGKQYNVAPTEALEKDLKEVLGDGHVSFGRVKGAARKVSPNRNSNGGRNARFRRAGNRR